MKKYKPRFYTFPPARLRVTSACTHALKHPTPPSRPPAAAAAPQNTTPVLVFAPPWDIPPPKTPHTHYLVRTPVPHSHQSPHTPVLRSCTPSPLAHTRYTAAS